MATAYGTSYKFFNAASFPGCQLWLDGADRGTLTLNGTTVTAWKDKSGLSNHASLSNTVTYNSADKSVQTNGTNSYFTSPLDTRKTTNTYYNVFMVYKWLGSGSNTNQSVWGNDVGGGWNRFQLLSFPGSTGIAYGLSRGATSPNTTNYTGLNTSNTLLYSANYAYNVTNGSFVCINGSQQTTFTEVAASPETTTQLLFFGQLGSDQYFASIAFYEIMVFRLQINDSDRQQIEGYLAWKWGLNKSLPTSHPYYNTNSIVYGFQPLPLVTIPPNIINNKPGPSQTFPTRNTQGKFYFIDTPLWFALGVPTSNFSSALPITLAGNASYTSNILQLTPNSTSQTGTAFLQTRVRILRFSTQFNLRFDSTQADGATFCIQNSSSNAIGSTGGGLGYSGVGNSVAIRFDSWNGSGGNFSTDVLTGGTVSPDQAGSGVLNTTFGLTAGTTWNFLINASYDGTTLSYTIRNFNNLNQSFTSNRTIDIGTTIGSSNAWIGFTSATGGATETCSLISWNWSNSK